MRLCKSCPQSKDYPPDHDVLYEEWEIDKTSKGEIPDINGEEGRRQQDSAATEDEQNLDWRRVRLCTTSKKDGRMTEE